MGRGEARRGRAGRGAAERGFRFGSPGRKTTVLELKPCIRDQRMRLPVGVVDE